MLKLLAFDYGASSGRAMLGQFDGNLLSLKEIHRFPNEPVRVQNNLYWDILRLLHELKKGITKCVFEGHPHLASIGIDTWGVDFGLLDASGKLLSNPLHYRDGNSEGMIEEACKVVPKREIYMRTGIQFQIFNTLYQLLSLKNSSKVFDKASDMLFMPDLMRYFLTGEKSTEYTIASTSQMLNAASGNWDDRLLSALGLPQHILTNIIEPGTIAGRLTAALSSELSIGQVPVVAVAEHDTASAIVSVPAMEGRFAYLSSGTWSLLGIESVSPVINDDTYRMNYTNEGGFNRSIRLLKNIMGLWIFQECKRAWELTGQIVSFDELEEGAMHSEPFLALIDPDDKDFYLPGNMPEKIQNFCIRSGQSVPRTQFEITRCIMESLALKYRMALEGLEKILGYFLPVLHIVGGGCKNKILSQFTANAINRPVIAGPVEATSAGNVICQMIALGEVKNLAQGREVIEKSFPSEQYVPTDTSQWDAAYEKFIKICNGVGGILYEEN